MPGDIDRVKRAVLWIRTAFRITDKTTLPGTIGGEIAPVVDTFGWSRRSPTDPEGAGPQSLNANGALIAQTAQLPAVPDNVMRFVISASWQTDDAAQVGFLTGLVRNSGLDIAIQEPFLIAANAAGVRIGLNRNLLLEPGDILLVSSSTAPAAGQRLSIRYRFVDIDIGEYLPPV